VPLRYGGPSGKIRFRLFFNAKDTEVSRKTQRNYHITKSSAPSARLCDLSR